MAEVGVLVIVDAEGFENLRDVFWSADFAQALGGEELYAAAVVFKGREEDVELIDGFVVAEDLDRLSADFGIGVFYEGAERVEGELAVNLDQLTEAPDGVEAGVGRGVGLGGRSGEGGDAFGLAGGEFELGGAADAAVCGPGPFWSGLWSRR